MVTTVQTPAVSGQTLIENAGDVNELSAAYNGSAAITDPQIRSDFEEIFELVREGESVRVAPPGAHALDLPSTDGISPVLVAVAAVAAVIVVREVA